jgi:hypothetical protein
MGAGWAAGGGNGTGGNSPKNCPRHVLFVAGGCRDPDAGRAALLSLTASSPLRFSAGTAGLSVAGATQVGLTVENVFSVQNNPRAHQPTPRGPCSRLELWCRLISLLRRRFGAGDRGRLRVRGAVPDDAQVSLEPFSTAQGDLERFRRLQDCSLVKKLVRRLNRSKRRSCFDPNVFSACDLVGADQVSSGCPGVRTPPRAPLLP